MPFLIDTENENREARSILLTQWNKVSHTSDEWDLFKEAHESLSSSPNDHYVDCRRRGMVYRSSIWGKTINNLTRIAMLGNAPHLIDSPEEHEEAVASLSVHAESAIPDEASAYFRSLHQLLLFDTFQPQLIRDPEAELQSFLEPHIPADRFSLYRSRLNKSLCDTTIRGIDFRDAAPCGAYTLKKTAVDATAWTAY